MIILPHFTHLASINPSHAMDHTASFRLSRSSIPRGCISGSSDQEGAPSFSRQSGRFAQRMIGRLIT